MTRLFLFGTLIWGDLLARVAGRAVACVPATLPGWQVARAAAGDWPVLVAGGETEGLLTEPLGAEALARLDAYEAVFGYASESVEVAGPEGPVAARVYRGAEAGAGPWSLDAWRAAHGARTMLAAEEILRAVERDAPEAVGRRLAVIRGRAQGMLDARARIRTVTAGQETPADAVRVLEVRHPHDGFHRVEAWRIDHPRFDGGRSGPIAREISHVTDAATVLPWDPARDRVLVVEQLRIGALAKGDPRPWLLEPVAGLVDAGETAETTALRELEEEAGLVVGPGALHLVARYYPSPGGLAQVLTSYVAVCDLPDGSAGLHGLAAEHEDIRGHLVDFADLMAMVASGEAANAPLIMSAQWLALHRDRLERMAGAARDTKA